LVRRRRREHGGPTLLGEVLHMANLNRVFLIGRLTRDPEVRVFASGGKVAQFGFAVNNRRKNIQTGEWEDDPVYLDCEAFNRGEYGKLADLVERYLGKGRQIFIDGHLKLKIVVDNIQFLDAKGEGSNPASGVQFGQQASAGSRRTAEPSYSPPEPESAFETAPPFDAGIEGDEKVPF
jgi:single-strand DNA-binding protein